MSQLEECYVNGTVPQKSVPVPVRGVSQLGEFSSMYFQWELFGRPIAVPVRRGVPLTGVPLRGVILYINKVTVQKCDRK